jgi:fumarate reductase subunit C
MWGHLFLVGSILTGERGFNWLAGMLEDYYIAQPTVFFIFVLFLVHAALASRKIPAQLKERRRMLELGRDLSRSGRDTPAGASSTAFEPHLESLLWIWQVRTGMIILVLGSFHLILLGVDVLTPLFGEARGIEAGCGCRTRSCLSAWNFMPASGCTGSQSSGVSGVACRALPGVISSA